ncbi:MAG: hypothetical protein V4437_02505 [Patescibacteria group bacterium]
MEKAFEFSIKREGAEILPDGSLIIVEIIEPLDFYKFGNKQEHGNEEDETAAHEAEHAVVAVVKNGGLIEASIISGNGSLGHVLATSDDPVITASSHGRSGNGSDRKMVENIHGEGSFERFGREAHKIILANKQKVRNVARALLREKKLTGARVEEIMRQSDERDLENVRIRIVRPDGGEEIFMKKAKEGEKIKIDLLAPADLPRDQVVTQYPWKPNDERMVA